MTDTRQALAECMAVLRPKVTGEFPQEQALEELYRAALAAQPVAGAVAWRCFHCDETFTDATAAQEHFGPSEHDKPACQMDIGYVRWLLEQHRRNVDDDSEALRTVRSLAGEHETLRRRAEEQGYARGLAEAKKHPEELGLVAAPQPQAAPAPEPSAQGEPVAWEGAEEWMPLAWELCADECGEEACTELVWEGGPIPEPWGDRWLKYEDEAKRLIALVHKHVPLASAPSTPPPAVVEAVPMESWPIERAADMLTAYAELVKATGRYAEEHYIPEIENVAAELRGIAPKAAQPVAGAVATEPSEEIQELRAQVEAWRKQCETLTNQVICCGVAARHPDATLTTRGAYAGKWNSPQAEEVRKLRAERDALLAAAPQPAPSAQAVAHPSHQTVREWMPVSEALRLSDLWTAGDLDNCGQWRAAIKVLADEVRALAASPQPAEPSAQGEPVAWISPKDRVPKGGEVVLCLFRDKGIHTALFRGTSTTHGVFEAWHGFLVADLPTDRVIGWVPLA